MIKLDNVWWLLGLMVCGAGELPWCSEQRVRAACGWELEACVRESVIPAARQLPCAMSSYILCSFLLHEEACVSDTCS